jgi:anthranilate synthase/aminodeoxychorismate synthase-like glutamine amidotransferase
MLLMIDNYDSFTWNLVQYFAQLGQEVQVFRNDAIDIETIAALKPKGLLISPGPCSPNEAGISLAAIHHFADTLPILGVCLGHQAIAQAFGAQVVRAGKVMHGKNSLIEHDDSSVFKGLAHPLDVTRYHSLVVAPETLPDCLRVTAWTLNGETPAGEIMGLAHKTLPIHGVQFHPEAILTQQGLELLANFVQICADCA